MLRDGRWRGDRALSRAGKRWARVWRHIRCQLVAADRFNPPAPLRPHRRAAAIRHDTRLRSCRRARGGRQDTAGLEHSGQREIWQVSLQFSIAPQARRGCRILSLLYQPALSSWHQTWAHCLTQTMLSPPGHLPRSVQRHPLRAGTQTSFASPHLPVPRLTVWQPLAYGPPIMHRLRHTPTLATWQPPREGTYLTLVPPGHQPSQTGLHQVCRTSRSAGRRPGWPRAWAPGLRVRRRCQPREGVARPAVSGEGQELTEGSAEGDDGEELHYRLSGVES